MKRLIFLIALLSVVAVLANPLHGAAIAVLGGPRSYIDFASTSSDTSTAYGMLLADGHSIEVITTLTQPALSGHDTLLIPLLRTDSGGLTTSEGPVLLEYLSAGGNLVFIGEHANYGSWRTVDNTVLNPIGFNQVLIQTPSWQIHNLTNTSHPIASGPHGTTSTVTLAAFGVVESQAGMVSLLDYGPGSAIATANIGLGRAVFLMDSDMIINSSMQDYTGNSIIWRNTFAYVPEPGSLTLLIAGAGLLLSRRGRR